MSLVRPSLQPLSAVLHPVFVALAVCIAVKLGYYPSWMFFQCFVAIALFYCAHWQTYVSGSLRFGK